LNCKNCGDPDWAHHPTTGECQAVHQRIVRRWEDIQYGFRALHIETEVIDECRCKGGEINK
jgi:hypothetical protein